MLSIKQAADILSVHWKTVYNHIRNGTLKASQIGRQWRIKPEDLDRYINRKQGWNDRD